MDSKNEKLNISNELNSLLKHIKENVVEELSVKVITPDIFVLYSISSSDTMLYKAVNGFLSTVSIDSIYEKLYTNIHDAILSPVRPNFVPEISDSLEEYLTLGNEEREKVGSANITSNHVLLAMLKSEVDTLSKRLFESEGLTYSTLLSESQKLNSLITTSESVMENVIPTTITVISNSPMPLDFSQIENIIGTATKSNKKNMGGIQFCKNLNGLASIGKIDPVIGRDNEIREIEKVFSRRKCNNAILVGKPGVGKTAIVEGLAWKICNKKAPFSLLNKTIYSLKVSELFSNTALRGAFEEKVGKVFSALKSNKNSILFIDDAHTALSSTRKDEFDLLSTISEYINGSDIQIILATTIDGYRTLTNGNKDMQRRFHRIDVNPLSIEDTISVLKKMSLIYGNYHKVVYSDEAIETCAKLCERYLTDTSMPSSAIDIMDEAGAMKKIALHEPVELSEKLNEYSLLSKKKEELILKDEIEESELVEKEIEKIKSDITELSTRSEFTQEEMTITSDDIRIAVSKHTGIPVSKVNSNDRHTLRNIESTLNSLIIGQEEAIKTISTAIKRNKIGLSRKNRPTLSAFLCGTTGVGKTLTAKKLASEIFGDEKYLVRFDMSEYADKTSLNKLIGTGAGYIGYDNGGLLTEAIKNHKYAVLLFDEIEKADEEIYNMLLQVIEDGFLTDNMGNKVDFRNTIVLFTSNIGSKEANSYTRIGFSKDDSVGRKDIMEKELKNKFPPEFINRLDAIVFFNDLNDDNLKKIIGIELESLNNRLKENGFSIEYDNSVIDFILSDISEDKKYGARPIIRTIEKYIETPLVDEILNNEFESHQFKITAEKDKIYIDV